MTSYGFYEKVTTMSYRIRIEGLAKHYSGFDLKDIDLEVPEGMVVGLIGSNGAGKTTLIKSLLGLITPQGGSIDLLGERIFEGGKTPYDQRRASELKQRIGVVFDACSFPEELHINEVQTMMRHTYHAWDDTCFISYLRQFNLAPKKRVKELSRGMGMKLGLACALSHNAELLILDEATAGLDPLARDEILQVFQQFMDGSTSHAILISSHITSDLEKIADSIVCIDEGSIVFTAEKDSIVSQAGIAQCRAQEFERIVADGYFSEGELRFSKSNLSVSVLVHDRFEFRRTYQDLVVNHATIDEYMNLMLKGERR